MNKFYPPYKKEVFEQSLELRKKLTFRSEKDIFTTEPPFPREITLDINNRCNHKCYFCANPKIRKYDALDLKLAFKLMKEAKENVLTRAVVKASRVTEKQKEAPLTVESIGIKAIKDAPAASFYESLGNLKGVDVTDASLGFRVVNTRGFNSTSPVRSLQLIDGVDNQSPGLNFSLGNFLGASDIGGKQ